MILDPSDEEEEEEAPQFPRPKIEYVPGESRLQTHSNKELQQHFRKWSSPTYFWVTVQVVDIDFIRRKISMIDL